MPKSSLHHCAIEMKVDCRANHLRREKRKIMRRKVALWSNFSVVRSTAEGETDVVGFMVLMLFYVMIVKIVMF